ncbi:Stealth CR1 domain-containing protein [Aminobacter sp. HY435]|uniref:Stealth CR1 domain-containing protein n=1 Tax=Aminobacter sp. HY435 TaxID=2970917 RepID=UPI0022B94A1F|nr:Stealth CR1 domain-containing protein [Aminobacter sp. HY435]
MARQSEISDAIDVVIPWVDGNDPDQQASLARYWPRLPWLQPPACRFRENGELRYSLRSIHRNLPWVRTIHLVTNGQVPPWLDVDHPGINLITHEAFFADPSSLPTFSSSAIEANLLRIGRVGVSNRFLLFNDDFFVGQPVPREEFVAADGASRLHALACRLPRLRMRGDRYQHVLGFNNLLLSLSLRRRHWAYPAHVPLLMDLRDLAWLDDKYAFWLRRTARHRFRYRTDALARVLYINAVAERDRDRPDGARLAPLAEEHVIPVRDSDEFSRSLERLVDQPPRFFCLNDEIDDDDRASVRAAEMQAALEAIFPAPAPFETDCLGMMQAVPARVTALSGS